MIYSGFRRYTCCSRCLRDLHRPSTVNSHLTSQFSSAVSWDRSQGACAHSEAVRFEKDVGTNASPGEEHRSKKLQLWRRIFQLFFSRSHLQHLASEGRDVFERFFGCDDHFSCQRFLLDLCGARLVLRQTFLAARCLKYLRYNRAPSELLIEQVKVKIVVLPFETRGWLETVLSVARQMGAKEMGLCGVFSVFFGERW